MGIGAKIKEYRTKAGLTQKDLADKLYVTYQAVSRWENDEAEPSIDTIKEMCNIFSCSTDELFEIEKKQEEKPIDELVNTLEQVKEQESKAVLGICDRCSKLIYDKDDLTKHEESHIERNGRSSHTVKKTVILCKECDEKRIFDEREKLARIEREKQASLKKRRIHSFVWPIILAITFIIIAVTSFANGNTKLGFLWILIAILGYSWLATMILNNSFITDLWMEITSWGFVRMPGIIFSFSFGGIAFLIVVKVFLFLLGITLALGTAALATVIAMALSIFVYPFALSKNIKGKE